MESESSELLNLRNPITTYKACLVVDLPEGHCSCPAQSNRHHSSSRGITRVRRVPNPAPQGDSDPRAVTYMLVVVGASRDGTRHRNFSRRREGKRVRISFCE